MDCQICLETIQQTNSCTTPCGHQFCFKCMIKSMEINTACPCCRAEVAEVPDNGEEEEEEDSEYEEDIEDDSTIESNFEDDEDEDEDKRPDVDSVTNAFVKLGYDVKDVMSLLLCRYSKTDEKYTREYIRKMNDDFDTVMEEIHAQIKERENFSAEDIRI